jgi:hypothetical protein
MKAQTRSRLWWLCNNQNKSCGLSLGFGWRARRSLGEDSKRSNVGLTLMTPVGGTDIGNTEREDDC